jgi:ribokinase
VTRSDVGPIPGLVAVVGSLNADITMPVEHLPQPGETVLTRGPAQLSFGGKGANQAASAAAFGGQVAMIGRVGDDDNGRQIIADLAGRGVETAEVFMTAGERTGTATIAVDTAGENLILVDPGANSQLAPDDITTSSLGRAGVLLVQLEIPLHTVQAAVRVPNALVVLNPAPAAALAPEILDFVDVLVPNRSELGHLTGTAPPDTTDGLARLAREFAQDTDVVVTLGRDGALIVARAAGVVTHIASPRVAVRDGTGAGDCFCGSLAVLLADGADLVSAARVAVAAASISTTGLGARGRLPSRTEAEQMAAQLRTEIVTI